jgi:hypothetical protein
MAELDAANERSGPAWALLAVAFISVLTSGAALCDIT